MSYLAIIPILAFLIVIHELGHFFAARSVGVKVEEFGIGLPPRAKAWRWKDVKWSLNWIPFGGFVRVKGEDAKDMEPGSMNVAGPWQRAWFLLAGPLMNLLAAIGLSIILVGTQGVPTRTNNLYIDSVSSESPADAAGWQAGDRIVAVDGEEMNDAGEIVHAINSEAGNDVSVTIQRGDEHIQTTVTPREDPPQGEGATGITFNPDGRLSNISVRDVAPGSPAAEAGVEEGDLITAINGIPIEAFAQAQAIMNANQGSEVELSVERDDEPVTMTLTVPEPAIIVRNVEPDSIANRARLYAGDRIVAVNGEPVTTGSAFVSALSDASGSEAELTYQRNDGEDVIENTTTVPVPDLSETETNDPLQAIGLGAAPSSGFRSAGIQSVGSVRYEDVPASRVVQEGWSEFWLIITTTFEALSGLFSGEVGIDNLAGPIGMGQITGEMLSASPGSEWVVLLNLTILISISLGIFNLLPIPALDGGRLLFVAIEILRGGKRIAPEKEGLVHLVGMVLLLALMFFIAFGDITRILDGESMIP